jgi:hypothetical protein
LLIFRIGPCAFCWGQRGLLTLLPLPPVLLGLQLWAIMHSLFVEWGGLLVFAGDDLKL